MTVTAETADAPLPWQGLLEVLSSYAGKGQLYAAVAAVAGTERWSASDVRRRARRLLLAQALPAVARWPDRAAGWWEALPPVVNTDRALAPAPAGRVDWARTRSRGWPPADGFWTRTRHRSDDEVLVKTLGWTLRRLADVRDDAAVLVPGIDARVGRQLDAAMEVSARLPSRAGDERPDRPALAATAASGRPWGALAEVARVLSAEDTDLEGVARRLLLPDEAARGRLFQLACVGVALRAARAEGATAESLRPLGAGSGPAYAITDRLGRHWDLWVEAGGMFGHYRVVSPYVRATAHLPGVSQPLGADIALVLPGRHALVLECKYSNDVSYVTRNGYEQVLAYQAEVLSGLVSTARAAVVGPDGVLSGGGGSTTALGRVDIVPAAGLPRLVRDVLAH